jgi:preprotein translocase subunit SecG
MYSVVVVVHILACVALIMIVLLQTGRGAEMGAAFGGASQTLFGGSGGTTFLSKLTTAAAVVFMLTCLGLSYISSGPQTKSVMDNVPVEIPQGPAIPEAKPVQPLPEQPAAPEASAKPAGGESVPAQPPAAATQQAAPAAKDAAAAAGGKKSASQDQGKQQQKKSPATQPKQQ